MFTLSSEYQNILKKVKQETAKVCNININTVTFPEKKEIVLSQKIQGTQLLWTELCPLNPNPEVLLHNVTVFRDKAFNGEIKV